MHGSWCVILLMLQKSDEHQWSLVVHIPLYIRGGWSIPGGSEDFWSRPQLPLVQLQKQSLNGFPRQTAVELAEDHFDEGAAAMAQMRRWYPVTIVDLVVPVMNVTWDLLIEPPTFFERWLNLDDPAPKSSHISGRLEVALESSTCGVWPIGPPWHVLLLWFSRWVRWVFPSGFLAQSSEIYLISPTWT